jgi:preprotein translocase SecE subunit
MTTTETSTMADRSEQNLPVRREESQPPSRPAPSGDDASGFLYRPGEGYWVRVITAVAVAAVFLFGAAWAFQSLSAINVPMKAWDVTVKNLTGEASSGVEVEYITRATATAEPEVIGRGRVTQVNLRSPTEAIVRIEDVSMNRDKDPRDAQSLRIGPAGKSVEGNVTASLGIAKFDLAYLQTGVAITLIVFGAGFAYYIAGLRRGAVDFLIATDSEMRKVNWSTRREIIGSTNVVITAFFLIGFVLFVLDYCFSHGFMAIDLLRRP